MADNITAFLKLIRFCEHFPHEPTNDNYKTLYGGGTVESFDDHPRKKVTKWGHTSTAAGAYQITEATYDDFKKRLGLMDFKPESQDKIAAAIIKQAGALDLINEGKIEDAIGKLKGRWASLPGGSQAQVKLNIALEKFEQYKK